MRCRHICGEAGATVASNVRLRDLNVHAARQDERRIEVIANRLAVWVDTTLISPLTSANPQVALPALHSHSRAEPRTAPTLSSSPSISVAAGALKLPPLSDLSRASA